MKTLLEKFKQEIKEKQLFKAGDGLLIAVSGGVDSVVLCELCKQAGYYFTIAHCNFQLRGEESNRDEQFVTKLSKKYEVNFFVKKFDTEKFAGENKLSIQEAARELRYGWFNELIEDLNKPDLSYYLLTAHHADDNIETLLMNFFRGTGLAGLTGIPLKTGKIIRPLLSFGKKELIDFAMQSKLEFVEDSSNASSKYTRNFIRNELLPQMEKIYPAIRENLFHNIERFTEIEELYQLGNAFIKKKLIKTREGETHIPIKQLLQFNNRALIYEIIHDYGFTEKQIDEIIKLCDADNASYLNSPDNKWRIIRNRHWLIITPVVEMVSQNIIIEPELKEIRFSIGKLRLDQTSNLQPPTSNTIAKLDIKDLAFPLLLRPWKPADYFYPLGMRKKKKVARFLIDNKLSKTEKEKVWVLESNKKIIWVVGYRIDDRFKITDKTKKAIKIEFLPA